MASASLSDLKKTLSTFFANPNASTISKDNCLPQNVNDSIAAFLENHTKLSDAESQNLQEELLEIREKSVIQDKAKLGAFLQTLRLLKRAVVGQTRVQQWWETTIAPVLDGVGYKHVEIDHARGFILDVLENGAGEEAEADRTTTSAFFANILLAAYLKKTTIPESGSEGRVAEDQFVGKQLEAVLVSYGSQKPKAFLMALDRLLLERSHRLQALTLLCALVRTQPPQLHKVTETPVIEHLIKSLMIDTSTTATSLALTALTMLLPHIPSSVRTHLPRLFLIYSRLLCWDRVNPSIAISDPESYADDHGQPHASDAVASQPSENDEWEKLQSSFETTESTQPELQHFFTFLYGLYPLNFTSYVHKPRKYLKKINFPRAEEFDLDQSLIRKKSEQFRRVHVLHPNFFNTDLEDELEDDRWLKADPADVVAECMGLCIPVLEPLQAPGPPPSSSLPAIPGKSVRTKDIPPESLTPDALKTPNRGLSTPGASSTNGSPLSSARDGESGSVAPGLTPVAGSTPLLHTPSSMALSSPRTGPLTREQMPKSPALRPTTAVEANMAYLQREVMLLRSDLNFERYLKSQHLSHIGQLQRRSIKDATVEAETQNMLNTNRTLKAQLDKANESYSKLKRETITGRSQSKKWEADLAGKVRTLKEDEKKWQIDGEDLRVELARAQKDCDHLRQLFVDVESKELSARQELQFANVKLEQLDTLKTRMSKLEDTIRQYQRRELEFSQSSDEKEALQRELDTANLMIQGRDASAERSAKNFNHRIRELETQLDAARNPLVNGTSGPFTPQVQTLIDAAVAGINAKYYKVKRDLAEQRHQYVELEMRYKTLQHAMEDATQAASTSPQNASGTHHTSTSAPTAHIPPSRPTTSPSLQESLDTVYASTSAPAPASHITRGSSTGSSASRPAPSPISSNRNLAGPIALPAIRAGSPLLTSLNTTNTDGISPATANQLPGGHRLPARASATAADTMSINSSAAMDNRSASRWSIDSWDRTTQDSKMSETTKKEKIGAKDQVRVRGRGGAQNIGKKKTEEVDSGLSGGAKKKGLSALLGR